MIQRYLSFIVAFCLSVPVFAQTALVRGQVYDQDSVALEFVSIAVKDARQGTVTNADGQFSLRLIAQTETVLIFKYLGFKTQEVSLSLKPDEVAELSIVLQRETREMQQVEVQGDRYRDRREEISLIKIDPKSVKELPSAFNDFNKILATLPGVISNNELSSEYSVRGGNFDENLVYVNDIEIYRPFLVRAGQQEGLSFVNPDLVSDVEFSTGGWQPRYGDKLSSVLNIQYKEPRHFAGSISAGLLGATAHVEGSSSNQRVTYVVGARQKSSRYLLNRLPVQGDYFPRFYDLQSYVTIRLGKAVSPQNPMKARTTLGVLASLASNQYYLEPRTQQVSFGTFTAAKRINVGYIGSEQYQYKTYQGGLRLSHHFNKSLRSDIIASAVTTSEREQIDVEGGYSFCEVVTQFGSENYNKCVNQRDVGTYYNYARNVLNARIFTLTSRNYFTSSYRSRWEWGGGISHETITDRLYEYNFIDSADYITKAPNLLNANLGIASLRYNAYLQHSYSFDSLSTLTYGVRVNYWTLNRQFLISPRVQYSYKPAWERDVLLKVAAGYYSQPPFYRELRNQQGELNLNLKAQNSVHVIAGADYNFLAWNRPFKFTSEVYYKHLWNVVPYDVDNVRIRYFAQNNARAYATGADFRVGGEFIKGAESWFSLGIMDTREDIQGDSIRIYNEEFEVIDKQSIGYVRRPSNQTVTAAILFQDHLPNNPSVRMFLNLVFGSGLPFGPPGSLEYRALRTSPFYRRVDLGFSKLITFGDKSTRVGKHIESVWLGAEILNIIGANNVISYQWIKDLDNRNYAVPNTLSARYLNLRMITKF